MRTHELELKDTTVLYKTDLQTWQREELFFFLDGQSPNWISTDERGSFIFNLINGKNSFGDLIEKYVQSYKTDWSQSWLYVHTFVSDLLRREMVFLKPVSLKKYRGRSAYLKAESLKEFWIHLTQTCNLSCTHCLVSSSPKGEMGLGTDFYLKNIDEACELGVQRFYFTGGEPFVRSDIFSLIRYVTEKKKKDLIVLSNATLFQGERLFQLKELSRDHLKFQVSLDGITAETNDAIRGAGVFSKTSEGLKVLSELGFEVSLTAAVTKANLKELEQLPSLAKKLGARSIHLMWLHKRGRILDSEAQMFPTHEELLLLTRKVYFLAQELGISFDNMESLKLRVNGQPSVKYDLGALCWESLCLYMDGNLYPSAAMAGHSSLRLGSLSGSSIKTIWQQSPLAQQIRNVSVANKIELENDGFRFLTGGGDIEHSYLFSSTENGCGKFTAQDPYYDLYVDLMKDLMLSFAMSKKIGLNLKTGFSAPVILHAMGEDAIACSEDALSWLENNQISKVRLLHSNCVLSFDVEKPYKAVQKFYGNAAEKPQAELCCPVKYEDNDMSHIPKEVIDRFYGCGSPMSSAQIQSGETVLDLGSGAGIDCFIAAKKVGAKGTVYGIDMTPQMLEVAHRCKTTVAENLGYDVVQFKKGYLENIPVEEKTVDLVTSNCVINLSPNKKKVFSEIWRILKDNGRFCVADIICNEPVPLSLQAHQDLWGECISGSLSESEFIAELEKAGFYGISIMKKTFWKEVQGYQFFSLTVGGYKFEKKTGCKFIGQKAVYLGPYKSVIDEEGHLFPRYEAVEVCTDTAIKLRAQPYVNQFAILESKTHSIIKIQSNDEKVSIPQENCCGSEGCC